jgi:endo-1,4-beta-xylanase
LSSTALSGAPIDAVGCHTHGASNTGSGTLKGNIDTIVKNTGPPVYITEYDIAQADDQRQLTQYKDHIQMFMNHPDIKGVTMWGYIVGAT